jgi:hypothetical protein
VNDKRRSDKGFESELESLYKDIAREEDRTEASSRVSDLGRCYALLQVNPDASMAEIAAAYEMMKDTWREDRFAHVEAWQGKAREKLAAIKEAYETILANRPFESANDMDDTGRRETGFSATLDEEETPEDDGPDDEPTPGRRSEGPVGTLHLAVAAVLATALVFIALFVWPTPYRYDIFRSSHTTYPLKINRLTGSTTYFDGRSWRPAPIVEDQAIQAPPVSKPTPSPRAAVATPLPLPGSPQPTLPADASPAAPIPRQPHGEPRPCPEATTHQTAKLPCRPHSPATPRSPWHPAAPAPAPTFQRPSLPPPRGRRHGSGNQTASGDSTAPAPSVRRRKTRPQCLADRQGRYSIQIRPFRRSKARAYMEVDRLQKEVVLHRACGGSGGSGTVSCGRFRTGMPLRPS